MIFADTMAGLTVARGERHRRLDVAAAITGLIVAHGGRALAMVDHFIMADPRFGQSFRYEMTKWLGKP